MIRNNQSEKRHVLPRWRSISDAIKAGELNSVNTGTQQNERHTLARQARAKCASDFKKHKSKWNISGDIADAEELLASSMILNRNSDPDVVNAAMMVARASHTRNAMREFAERVIQGETDVVSPTLPITRSKVIQSIRDRKRLLQLNPRDGLLVAETALLYANIGQLQNSQKLLERALLTAPEDRYILRASVRFFCHIGDPERALETIQKSNSLPVDPWLRAAELATCALLGLPPREWRKAKSMLDSGSFSDLSISELATQIGTFELASGSKKKALRILRKGAECPTENAVAQIEHVGRETSSFTPEDLVADLTASHEAAAHAAYWDSKWDSALDACERWHEIEPFSTRPAIFASFVASVRSSSLERGLALGNAALEANPGDPTLLNNIAVIQAYRGEISKAQAALDRVNVGTDDDNVITNLATLGLIAIRAGDIATGIEKYSEAIKLANDKKKYIASLRAYCFLGRELTRGQNELIPYLREAVDKSIEKLRKAGYTIPRDVTVLRSQYEALQKENIGPLFELNHEAIPKLVAP